MGSLESLPVKRFRGVYPHLFCSLVAHRDPPRSQVIRMYRLIFKKGSDDLYELLENDNLREYEIEGLLNLCKSLEESLESIKQGLNAKLQSLKQTRDLKSEL